jgi:hypothetical protein
MRKKSFSAHCVNSILEHEKFSEMCVWIVRFGQQIDKMGLFIVEKVNI